MTERDRFLIEKLLHWKATGTLHVGLFLPAWRKREYPDEPNAITPEEARQLLSAFSAIESAVDEFERHAWYRGLQKRVRDTRERGLRGEASGVTLLCWSCAGRCLLTIGAEDRSVTLITTDSEAPYARRPDGYEPATGDKMGPMGVQSVDATADEAVSLIWQVMENWERMGIRPDVEVTVAGL